MWWAGVARKTGGVMKDIYFSNQKGEMNVCTNFVAIHPTVIETFHRIPHVDTSAKVIPKVIRLHPRGSMDVCKKN